MPDSPDTQMDSHGQTATVSPLVPVLETRGITKRFAGVTVLSNVDFTVLPGEIHGLIGQNGAGKSTLVKILTGAYSLDEGELVIDGSAVTVGSPHRAANLGLAIIHQTQNLVPVFSAEESVFLGDEPSRGGLLVTSERRRRASELLTRVGAEFSPSSLIRDLSAGQRQQVSIARALARRARLLILDEPTAPLSQHEIRALFRLIRDLRDSGTSIVYISHYLDEVFSLCDRVTILRDGVTQGTFNPKETSREDMVELMVGQRLAQAFPKADVPFGPEMLRMENVSVADHLHSVSLAAHAGEILGIAGLVGGGTNELCQVLFGALARDSGVVRIGETVLHAGSVIAAHRAGEALIPEDRVQEGLVEGMSVRDNLTLATMPQFGHFGVRNPRQETQAASRMVKTLTIRAPSLGANVRKLSGGNQQKVVLGKWLIGKRARVFVLNNPTVGVDVGAKADIYEQIAVLVRQGVCVVIASSDFEELVGLADRIIVLVRGSVVAEIPRAEASVERLLAAAGSEQQSHAGSTASPATSHQLAAFATRWGTLLSMALILCVLGFRAPTLFDPNTILTILKQSCILILIAYALSLALLAGGFDVSVGALSDLTSNLASGILGGGGSIFAAIAVGPAVGLLTGFVNALLIMVVRIPPFVATLLLTGLALGYNGGQALTLENQPAYFTLGQGTVGPIPVVVIITAVILVLLYLGLTRTVMGRRIYAVGQNAEATRLAGIAPWRPFMTAFLISGMICGFAGVVESAYSSGSSAGGTGLDFVISALAAAFLGSTATRIGAISVVGTTVGAVFVTAISNALILNGLSNTLLPAVQGGVLIVALGLRVMRQRQIGQITIF
jgi:ABC-type sugar transport system ATPase subunit/ribose/xylose/arabinose/galactoside ABC-type transport system permease subunit